MNAVIYARYSSAKQDEMSIEAQVRACREYAVSKGYNVVKVYSDEAISGKGTKTAQRKQYQSMIKDSAKKQFDIILVHKYDRVARNVGEHVNLEMRLSENGVTLVAVAQDFGHSKEAKIMKTLMWSLSEYYIDNLSEEVKKGHREIALQGKHNGGYAPFGYDVVNQEYVVNPAESEYVKKMFDCAVHKLGFTSLVEEMRLNSITGKRGRPMKYPQIYEILRNEKYTGLYTYSPQEEPVRGQRRAKPNAIKIENALPKIIDKALFDEVQRIMNERKQTGVKSDYLCSGLVYCGNCGAKMYGMTTHRKGHEYRVFYCPEKCGTGTVSMDFVDGEVKLYLMNLLSEKTQAAVGTALRDYSKNEKSRVESFNAAVRVKAEEKQQQIENYMSALGNGVLPAEVVADIGVKIASLKNEIKTLNELPVPKDYTAKQVAEWMKSLAESTDEHQTIELLVERIDATKTEVNVTSTLASVLEVNGGWQ